MLRLFGGNRKNEGYLIICTVNNNDEAGDLKQNEWDGKINVIKKILKQNEQKIIENSGNTEKRVNEINVKVGQIKDEMNKQGDITHGKIEESQNKVEKDLTLMKEEINTVKEEVKALKQLTIDSNERLLESIKDLLKPDQSNQASFK